MKNNKLRLLIAGDKTRFIHLKQFTTELKKIGIESKLIHDIEFIDKFFQMNIKKKIERDRNFKKILKEFEPDAVLLDRISKIGKKVIEQNIPLLILLRGNYWEESSWAKKTIYKSRKQKLMITRNEKLTDYCFSKSDLILPISKYLEKEVIKRYPKKNILVFPADGRNPSEWKKEFSNKLKHPCVGLVQGLNIWGKTRELLTLNNVMKELPEITFYLAGDGLYSEKIIPSLTKNTNFVWLKNLDYPKEVKKFLSEIDIFLSLTGLEGLGQTIIESLLMKKPTIASNTGGVPELIIDNKTGLLVEPGDEQVIIEKIRKLIDEPEFGNQIAETGYEFVKKEFAWEEIAKKFKDIIKTDWGGKNIE